MNKKHTTLLIILLVSQVSVSQNQWAWITGEKSANINRVYGTQGVASPSNNPGSRIGAAYWTDQQGNLWLFGGWGNDGNTGSGLLNDLWTYNITTGYWTWMGGDKNQHANGTFEKKGKASRDNMPGARRNAVCWTHSNGDFWLFGGRGLASHKTGGSNDGENEDDDDINAGLLNDLWMYSVVTGQWTFVSGSDKQNQHGIYGTRTVASASNYPGGRYSASGWLDINGNLWLFGGRGYTSRNEIGLLDDVWKYSPSDNSWTWMTGDESGNENVNYGQQGHFANSNTPGGRHGCISWADNNGDFWLFGGGTLTDLFADMWKYDHLNNRWGWISGSTATNQKPLFTNQGVPDPNGNPGARTLSAVWVDAAGEVWLFGGNGYGGDVGSHPLNSLWKYSVATNEWAFMKGDISINPTPVYGSKGIAAADNTPGGTASSSFWKDEKGNFWVFGGRSKAGYLNQVWKLSPGCGEDISGTISPASASICEGSSQVLTASGGTSYEWRRNDVIIPGETSPTLIVGTPGTYSVLIRNNSCVAEGSNTSVVSIVSSNSTRYADVHVTANIPARLSARSIGITYEWSPSTGLDNPSSPSPTVTISEDVQYIVRISPEQGCPFTDTAQVSVRSDIKIFVPTAFTPNGNNVNDRLRPLSGLASLDYFRVYNRWGNKVYETNEIGAGWDGRYNGVPQPSDTYTWVLSGTLPNGDPVKVSGKALLIR